MALITEEGKCVLEPGKFKIFIGGCQPDKKSRELLGENFLDAIFEITGNKIDVEY